MLKPLLYLIALSQLALGGLCLFVPVTFFALMGLTAPAPDNGYMIGMLGVRFVAYGIGMLMLARQSEPSRFWLGNMLFIQMADFVLGAVYAGAGIVPMAVVSFPMINAALFSAGLSWALWRPAKALA
jgi:hypothetical protein